MKSGEIVVNRTSVKVCTFFFFLFLGILLSIPARAARPIPYENLKLPALTKQKSPTKAAMSYSGAPVVNSVTPDYGPRHGWTRVDIRGKNFRKGLKVLVGGKEATRVKVVSSTRILARTPENTFLGSGDVVVRNPDGRAGGLLNGFLYEGGIFEAPGYNVPPDWHWATDIQLVDMNKDGKRDFLIIKPWKPLDPAEMGNLVIYLQGPDRDGDGVPNFEPVRRSKALNDTKNHYTAVETFDLDKDGDMDFVATGRVEYFQGTMRNQINRVFLNDGKCNFTVKDLPGNAFSKGVDIGDVNRDGNPDIIIANMGAQNQLFFGDGKGNFKNVTQSHMPKASMHTGDIHLVDVDGDRDLDAVVANMSPPKQKEGGAPNHLYINDGKGRFTNKTGEKQFPTGNQKTYRIDSADIDKDGDMDLALANKGTSQWLVNNGKGRFQVRPLPAYRMPGKQNDLSKAFNLDVQLTDINGDGYPDLVLCSKACSVMFYMNVAGGKGGRSFKAKPDAIDPIPMGHGAESIHLADVTGNGKPDLTIGSGHEQTPLFVNQWPKPFRFATANVKLNLPYTDWVARSCSGGDMNGDGKPDIAMGQWRETEVMLFLQGKNGWYTKKFHDPSILQAGKSIVEDVALVDVDGDKDRDLILGISGKGVPGRALLLNDGKANFKRVKGFPTKTPSTTETLPVDVDLDGDMDLVMCNWNRGLIAAGSQKNMLLINDGKGRFVDKSNEYLPRVKSTARGGDVGDVNGDGYPDIVLACVKTTVLAGPMKNQLYLNQGKKAPGRFVNASHLLPSKSGRSTDAAFLDADGDGRLDIVVVNEVDMKGKGGEDELYGQKKDGTFEDWSNRIPRISRFSWDVRILDFNLDKAPDIFSTRSYWNYGGLFGPRGEHGRLLLLANDGTGRFAYPKIRQFQYIDKELDSWTGSCTYDLNQDGQDEIIECVDGQVRFFRTFLRTKAVVHPVYAEIKTGQTISFDASSTRYPWGLRGKSFSWSFGDGGKGTGEKVSHRYKKRGTYTVKLTVTDNSDRKDSDRITVIVK